MSRRAGVVLAAFLAACCAPQPEIAPPAAPDAVVEAAVDPREGDPLGAAAADLRAAASDRAIVVLGEMHGTREVPALVARLVADHATTAPVRVALELPRDQQPALDDWLAGGDRAAAMAAMRCARLPRHRPLRVGSWSPATCTR